MVLAANIKLVGNMAEEQGSILIVDDEAAVRRLLSRRVAGEGYRCEEASTGDEALIKIRSDLVQLVVLDIKMPGRSGVELLPEIKAAHPDVAVIMATAITDTSTAIECMKQGAYDYITKPFNLDEVVLSIERALEKRRLELENRDYQQHLEQKVEEQAKKIRTSFLNAITALVYALEAKDKYTSGHSQRVSRISVAIATELGLPQQDVERIRLAGLIHDIGKIGVREAVLNKPGKVNAEEYQHILSHCNIGEHILTPIVEDEQILRAVRHHHERYDGTGYPDGLSGGQIPLGAKILAVADTYDAIISGRPYREAESIQTACDEIQRHKGTQFDPEVVGAFLRIRKSAKLVDVSTSET
jgi:putative two-component system response regulator